MLGDSLLVYPVTQPMYDGKDGALKRKKGAGLLSAKWQRMVVEESVEGFNTWCSSKLPIGTNVDFAIARILNQAETNRRMIEYCN